MNIKSQQGVIDAIKFKMRVFDKYYNFETDQMDVESTDKAMA